MLDITKDIQSLTHFRRKSAEVVRHLLTVNGKAEVAVQDAASYQRLLDIAAQADAKEGIRQGLEDMTGRRTRAAHEVFDEIRRGYGIPR